MVLNLLLHFIKNGHRVNKFSEGFLGHHYIIFIYYFHLKLDFSSF